MTGIPRKKGPVSNGKVTEEGIGGIFIKKTRQPVVRRDEVSYLSAIGGDI